MAEKEKKKPLSVEDIISDYQKYHHSAGKGFKERIEKWEEFNNQENIHPAQFHQHAHYVVFGKPTDLKSFPGAFNEAYKVLDKHLADDNDKLEDEDKLAEILEKYADTFLQNTMGKGFKETIAHAKEMKLTKQEVRELKEQLLAQYLRDEEGRPLNILGDRHIKGLKGTKKIHLIKHLQDIGEKTKEMYSGYLHQRAVGGLFSEEDRLDMAKYLTPIFDAAGWKHKSAHITRSIQEQAQHYAHLLHGTGQELMKAGYKPPKYEKKEKK